MQRKKKLRKFKKRFQKGRNNLCFYVYLYYRVKSYYMFASLLILIQAKDLQLSLILVCVVCMFIVTNIPRLLLNLYEVFNVDELIACQDFMPPIWFLCTTSVNHLLLVFNCIMNFVIYCYFNNSFR